ncbi:amidohydrolase family protein [Hyphococcus sp.]|uniref:amidohydrolase family protein n=1 Tax=Hyphococcus sp. TaxID=2038636 RepID=UPI003CCBEBC0
MVRRKISITLLSAIFGLPGCASNTPPAQPSEQLINGLWFTGSGFEPRVASIVDGRLAFDLPATDNATDLRGQYVIPPYCEAHNHNLGGASEGVDDVIKAYLQSGVFYAMMPGSFALYRETISEKLNNPDSVDVAFANNGLTGPGGHPRGLRESLMDRYGLYPEFTKETLPDKGYFEADSSSELHEKWALILADRPDFIKVMLYFSEEYETRKDDPAYYGKTGLNPALLPELITLAHDEGLRVAVHVESEADMVRALRADADIIAHLPSYDSTVRLSDATIALAAKSNTALITTMSLAKRYETRSPDQYAAILAAQKENLVRLEAANANLVLGSDNVRDTSHGEAQHLADIGALGNETLLRMWTENCAKTVFPDRKIGRLEAGYEASFLVLGDNPIASFSATRNITMRMKEGQLLSTEAIDKQ